MSVPLSHVTNPKIKKSTPRIKIAVMLDLEDCSIGNYSLSVRRANVLNIDAMLFLGVKGIMNKL